MNTKAVLPVACMALLLGTAGVRGQYPPSGGLPTPGSEAAAPGGLGGEDTAPQDRPPDVPQSQLPAPPGWQIGPTGLPLPPGAVPSPWIEYGRPGCCGPLGLDGPITYELYTRAGGNFIVGNGLFANSLADGWTVGGGGRTLFFDSPGQAAWVVDLGLQYSNNVGRGGAPRFEYVTSIPAQPTTNQNPNPVGETVRSRPGRIIGLDRTSLNFSLGREWFYYSRAFDTCSSAPESPRGMNARWGVDVGGRYGTSHVDLQVVNEDGFVAYGRQHGVLGSLFTAVHSDVEVPMGSWIFCAGIRFEYDHTWSKPLQGIDGTYHSIYLLGNCGIRF